MVVAPDLGRSSSWPALPSSTSGISSRYKIDWFYGRVFGQFALQSPQMLSSMRILPPWADFYSGKLDDASPAHGDGMAAMVKDDLDMLHRYDRECPR